jgi:hypothetical protein
MLVSERQLDKINKEGDEVYCEVINKELPGENERMNEISQNTGSLRPHQGSKEEPLIQARSFTP